MAYCAITDVEALNPKRTYDANSKPSSSQVESFIGRIANEIDTVLGAHGVTTPVVTPAEFAEHLKQMNAYGAAALAEMAMFPEAAGIGATTHGGDLWKIYRAALARLDSEDFLASLLSGTAVPFSFFTEHTGEEPQEDEAWREPKFKKNKEF